MGSVRRNQHKNRYRNKAKKTEWGSKEWFRQNAITRKNKHSDGLFQDCKGTEWSDAWDPIESAKIQRAYDKIKQQGDLTEN